MVKAMEDSLKQTIIRRSDRGYSIDPLQGEAVDNADFEPLGERYACVALNVHAPLNRTLHGLAATGMAQLRGDFKQFVGMRKANFYISFESNFDYVD